MMVMTNKTSLASRLRHRIVLKTPVTTPDGAGGFATSWNQFAEVWAEILPKNGNEKLQYEQLSVQKRIVITIRYLSGITEKMRIVYGEREFEILSILNPFEENILLEIMAEEKVEI